MTVGAMSSAFNSLRSAYETECFNQTFRDLQVRFLPFITGGVSSKQGKKPISAEDAESKLKRLTGNLLVATADEAHAFTCNKLKQAKSHTVFQRKIIRGQISRRLDKLEVLFFEAVVLLNKRADGFIEALSHQKRSAGVAGKQYMYFLRSKRVSLHRLSGRSEKRIYASADTNFQKPEALIGIERKSYVLFLSALMDKIQRDCTCVFRVYRFFALFPKRS